MKSEAEGNVWLALLALFGVLFCYAIVSEPREPVKLASAHDVSWSFKSQQDKMEDINANRRKQ